MMSKVWKVLGLMAALVLVIGAVPAAAQPAQQAGPINTLRVYGNNGEDANFPYEFFDGPFNLRSREAPPKDFVQFNPALLDKEDTNAHEQFGSFFAYIKAESDASEKVHLRSWYVPEYPEPRGLVPFPPSEPQTNMDQNGAGDIVNEYTYILVDDTSLNPVLGPAGDTRMVFPIAGFTEAVGDDPIGLDNYDVNDDGHPEIMDVVRIWKEDPALPDTQSTIEVRPKAVDGALELYWDPVMDEGDSIEFFDYRIELLSSPSTIETKAELGVWYTGYEKDGEIYLGSVSLWMNQRASVDARNGPIRPDWSIDWMPPEPVVRPFWFELESVGSNFVRVMPYRILTAGVWDPHNQEYTGETFFVDGAEYDVAAIYTEDTGFERELKYITIRNPLPKCPDPDDPECRVYIPNMTVSKRGVFKGLSLPMLPPFNYVHDEIDDTNIPETVPEKVGPDTQWPDNPGDLVLPTLWDRVMRDTPPYDGDAGDPWSYFAWIDETKEPRFDTNLGEEKFLNDTETYLETLDESDTFFDPVSSTYWRTYGPVQANHDGTYWADCDGNGFDPATDVTVFTNAANPVAYGPNGWQFGDEVPALPPEYEQEQYIVLQAQGSAAEDPDVTIEYCRTVEHVRVTDEWWQWINIETHPWDYTEFILPKRPDATDPDDDELEGDYILVSSFMTEDSDDVWEAWPAAMPPNPADDAIRAKFLYDAEVGPVHSADVYVNDADYNMQHRGVDANSLRVYGRAGEHAAFPYQTYDGPFNLKSPEAPPKDFVQFNPAIFGHHWGGEPFTGMIKADGDAAEKVHLRMWYDRDYPEPLGDVCRPTGVVFTEDIVTEYTYTMLKEEMEPDALHPTHGSAGQTRLVFPMAGFDTRADDPIGLDSYDVNGDGTEEIMGVEEIWPVALADEPGTTLGTIAVSPIGLDAGNMKVNVGESIQFLDYRVTLLDTSSVDMQADLKFEYVGWKKDIAYNIETVVLHHGPAANDTAIVSVNPDFDVHTWFNKNHPFEPARPVCAPFWVEMRHVGADYVTLKLYRYLQAGETFFVDGAEYDVSAIYVLADPDLEGRDEFKYISIRNPLPKGTGNFQIPTLSIWKTRVPMGESLPMLPPFDREHDMVDDIHLPEDGDGGVDGQCEDNPGTFPCQFQSPYDYIANRVVEDVPGMDGDPEDLLITWIDETKEPRFDVNLAEEKFTFVDELWQWINIETMPWDYTEFVLPELPEAEGLDALGYNGDYILVSSWMTEDSTDLWPAPESVRMKFVYDAACGTGIYVNTAGAECFGDFNGDGFRDTADIMLMVPHWNTACGDMDYEAQYDVDGDCDIDLADIMQVVAVWNTPCP